MHILRFIFEKWPEKCAALGKTPAQWKMSFIPILSLRSTQVTIVQSTRETGNIYSLKLIIPLAHKTGHGSYIAFCPSHL